MKTILAILVFLLMVVPAWADELKVSALEYDGKVIVLAMKGFEIGPPQATLRMKPSVGGVPGSVIETYYLLVEDGNNLTDESGNKLILE
jgi:hypothetical protein